MDFGCADSQLQHDLAPMQPKCVYTARRPKSKAAGVPNALGLNPVVGSRPDVGARAISLSQIKSW
jgi:hypothetical protein